MVNRKENKMKQSLKISLNCGVVNVKEGTILLASTLNTFTYKELAEQSKRCGLGEHITGTNLTTLRNLGWIDKADEPSRLKCAVHELTDLGRAKVKSLSCVTEMPVSLVVVTTPLSELVEQHVEALKALGAKEVTLVF